MTFRQWTIAAGASLMLVACGGNRGGGPPAASAAPADFTAFVNTQVQLMPADATPVPTDNFTNLGLDNPQSFSPVKFTGGDVLAAGVYSAATACLNAGVGACDPGLH